MEDALTRLLISEVSRFALVTIRIAMVVAVAPLPWVYAPVRVRGGMVLVLAFAVFEQAPIPEGLNMIGWMATAVGEAIIGLSLGFVVRLMLSAPEIMAGAISPNLGLGMAQIFDPKNSEATPILSKMFFLMGLWICLALGVHRWLLGSLILSFDALPVGEALNLREGSLSLLHFGVYAFEVGVRLAFPVLAVLFIIQMALAFISRAAPAMQIFSVGFAVTLIVGFVSIVATMPETAQGLVTELSRIGNDFEAVLYSLGR